MVLQASLLASGGRMRTKEEDQGEKKETWFQALEEKYSRIYHCYGYKYILVGFRYFSTIC